MIIRDDDAAIAAIKQEIREAESGTIGEIVVVMAGGASDYRLPYLAMLVFVAALAGPVIVFSGVLLSGTFSFEQYSAASLFQLAFIGGGWVLGNLKPQIRAALMPKRLKHRMASRLAGEQFFMRGLRLTEGRTGVLIFISATERYVEIIADKGISDKVPQGTWQDAVSFLTGKIGNHELEIGITGAIRMVGAVLQEHFPGRKDANELPDHLHII